MHHSLRSIISSEAKSNLSPPFAQPVDSSRLASLALAYSKGFVTWNQVSEETGIGFGDLLVALGSQNLQLPKVVAKRTPVQDGFYRQILDAAKADFNEAKLPDRLLRSDP